MLPEKVFTLTCNNRYIGCVSPRKDVNTYFNTKVFGFVYADHADYVKKRLQPEMTNKIQQLRDDKYVIKGVYKDLTSSNNHIKMISKSTEALMGELYMNNIDLKIIDSIKQSNTNIHLFSSFDIMVEIEGNMIIDSMNDLFSR
jgi:predicted HAD superfamily phosphohydrolase